MAARRVREPELFVNAREPGLGVGILVRRADGRRTYRFLRGGERSFNEAYCRLYIKEALNVAPEVRDQLLPPGPTAARRARKPLPRTAPPPPKASDAGFEGQIRERPDDDAPYLVYADWLQDQQDPRGQLIAIQHRRAEAPDDAELAAAEKALLRKHAAYFVPEALARALKLPRSSGPRCEVTWRNGFFAHVRLARDVTASAKSVDLEVVARALLSHPSARFLRSLALGPLGTRAYDYSGLVRAIAKRGHPLLAELHVGDFGPSDSELVTTAAGDVTVLFASLPALEKLTLHAGGLSLTAPIAHARLRELSLTTLELWENEVDALVEADLPALETLALRTEAVGFTSHQLAHLRAAFPNLRRLVVPNTRKTSQLMVALLGSPLLAHLQELDLSGGDLDDRAASEMMWQREKLHHLRKLDVGGSAKLSPDWARRLADATGAVADRSPLAITEADVWTRSPDRASLAAARKIAVAGEWIALGYDRKLERVWGEYEGRDHYYVYAHLRDRACGCGCGSPKYPCKHALALLLLAANKHAFPDAPTPPAVARTASPWRPSYGRDEY